MAQGQQQQPGHKFAGEHVEQYKFEKEPHHKGWQAFDVRKVLIPPSAGLGTAKRYYQKRTLLQYVALYSIGLWGFFALQGSAFRAGMLGLLFPGAGLVAVASLPALAAFALTIIGLPLTIFAWFAMGGLIFPLTLWFGTAGLAAFLARGRPVWEYAGWSWAGACAFLVVWTMWKTNSINKRLVLTAAARNKWLPGKVREMAETSVPAPEPGSRELDLKTLRFVQHMIERGLTKHDDFSYHDVIDQFQTSALRYQLYGVVSALAMYMTHYTPGFHGYLSEACRNSIEKSLTKRIMGFWKWERLAGKFSSDCDPIKKDNIMVTGYLAVAIGLYESASGDTRYNEKGSLNIQVTDTESFRRSFGDLADAVYNNMASNDYCLYPCEPNWVYTTCNLTGMAGLIVSSRILGNDYSDKIRPRFEKALEDEMTDRDGGLLPIRSELTGFTIPGICGTLTDCHSAMTLTSYLPHIGARIWAFIRNEHIDYDEKGRMVLKDLRGADKMDPGNYKGGVGSIRAFIAGAAAEYGDEDVRKSALDQLDNEFFPVEVTPSGAFYNKGLSTGSQTVALLARLCHRADLANATLYGPEPNAMNGPLLEECKFPDVLVAKAYSPDAKRLDIVLYNGKNAGKHTLGFERLIPRGTYKLGKETITADVHGKIRADVSIDGRTEISLVPA